MPLREPRRSSAELAARSSCPAIAVDVPAGKSLFLTVSPVADMYAGQNGRVPNMLKLDHLTLEVHKAR